MKLIPYGSGHDNNTAKITKIRHASWHIVLLRLFKMNERCNCMISLLLKRKNRGALFSVCLAWTREIKFGYFVKMPRTQGNGCLRRSVIICWSPKVRPVRHWSCFALKKSYVARTTNPNQHPMSDIRIVRKKECYGFFYVPLSFY